MRSGNHRIVDDAARYGLTKRWTPLIAHGEQQRLVNSPARFKVVPAGRRSGKTERAKRHLIKTALSCQSRFDDPAYFAAAPTRDQAKRIYWEDLKKMVPKSFLARPPIETELTLQFITGARITVVGMDKPERIEGTPWDGGILDEYANMKEEAWRANVRPGLADRNGWCWLIGVPEGRNHYYKTYKQAMQSDEDWSDWDAFTWKSADILPIHEVEAAMRDLDELTFRQEYEASFVNFEGQAYYPFEDRYHCAPLFQNYNPRAPLIVMFDFNVNPGICAIAQEMDLPKRIIHSEGVKIGDRVLFKNEIVSPTEGTGIIGEVHIPRNSNTPAVCRKFITDWGDHAGQIHVYGDATGGAPSTSQVQGSDWDMVKNSLYGHFGSERVIMKVPKGNPSERARINAVNSRLRTGDGNIHLMVDPNKAPMTVQDFEGVRLLEGGSGELDKKTDLNLTHLTDAIGYYVQQVFPVRKESFSITELRI